MAHWRSFYDSKYLAHFDLPPGRDVIVTIEKVEAGELVSQGGRKDKKPIAKFVGKEKGLALCKTNAKCIAAMYGHDTAAWCGKPIALYVTQTSSPDGMVDCIRIRPTIPRRRAEVPPKPEPPPPEDETLENEPAEEDTGT